MRLKPMLSHARGEYIGIGVVGAGSQNTIAKTVEKNSISTTRRLGFRARKVTNSRTEEH